MMSVCYRRFPAEIILLCVRWCCKYDISYSQIGAGRLIGFGAALFPVVQLVVPLILRSPAGRDDPAPRQGINYTFSSLSHPHAIDLWIVVL